MAHPKAKCRLSTSLVYLRVIDYCFSNSSFTPLKEPRYLTPGYSSQLSASPGADALAARSFPRTSTRLFVLPGVKVCVSEILRDCVPVAIACRSEASVSLTCDRVTCHRVTARDPPRSDTLTQPCIVTSPAS